MIDVDMKAKEYNDVCSRLNKLSQQHEHVSQKNSFLRSEIAELRSANAELKRQLEEAKWQAAFDGKLLNHIESELIGVQYVGPYDAGIRAIKQQLAESQAREARLREALTELSCLGNGNVPGNSIGNGIAQLALSIPHDDTALKEYRDAVIEECAKVCDNLENGNWDYLEGAALCSAEIRKLKAKP